MNAAATSIQRPDRDDAKQLPAVMRDKLQRIRLRKLTLVTMRAIGAACLMLAFGLLIAMTIDWCWTIRSPFARWAMTATPLILAASTLVALGWQPIAKALCWRSASKDIDAQNPSLQQRWTTVLRHDPDHPSDPRQSLMRRMVVDETVATSRIVDPSQIAPLGGLRNSLACIAIAAFGVFIFIIAKPAQTEVLWNRYWDPASNQTATWITDESGDASKASDDARELFVHTGGVRRPHATLTLEYPTGLRDEVQVESSQTDPDHFAINVDVDQTVRYQFNIGDAQTDWHTLQSIDPPEIAEVRFEVTPPDYLHRLPTIKDRLPRSYDAMEGSRLNLAIKAFKPLVHFAIELKRSENDEIQTVTVDPDPDGWYQWEMDLAEDVILRPRLMDDYGLETRRNHVCKIHILVDAAPLVRIIGAETQAVATNQESISIEFEAHDDVGITAAQLKVYDVDGDDTPRLIATLPIDLGDQHGSRHVSQVATLDLEKLGLEAGSEISYAIEVFDSKQTDSKQSESATTPSSDDRFDSERPKMESENLGQAAESRRRRVRVVDRLSAIAKNDDATDEDVNAKNIRDRITAIVEQLQAIDRRFEQLTSGGIADSQHSEAAASMDETFGIIADGITSLREFTRNNPYAFVGLQMIDIARTHIEPARDLNFVAIRDPSGHDLERVEARSHVIRATELIDELIKRYENVRAERELAEKIDETVKRYEVYVEGSQRLLRASRRNRHPLDRKMGTVEVDQDYLDRMAEVLEMRREMLKEFAEMLGDDPRLLSRYMDLIRRRRDSLREQLQQIADAQRDLSEELAGYQSLDAEDRQDMWFLIIDVRTAAAADLARDAAELTRRIGKQLPLKIDPASQTAIDLLSHAENVATLARDLSLRTDELYEPAEGSQQLIDDGRLLVERLIELDGDLDRIRFEIDDAEGLEGYADGRQVELGALLATANAWVTLSTAIADRQYPKIYLTEQRRLAFQMHELRVGMLTTLQSLDDQFTRLTDAPLPPPIRDAVDQLQWLLDAIMMRQVRCVSLASLDDTDALLEASQQVEHDLGTAGELFDAIRRTVANYLDAFDPLPLNIGDLRDPTLDEFLARLEREPDIAAQLGLPNRPTNLRTIAESMQWQQSGGSLSGSGEEAMGRAREAMKVKRSDAAPTGGDPEPKTDAQKQQELEQIKQAEAARKRLEETLSKIEKEISAAAPDSERQQRLQQVANQLRELQDGEQTAEQRWRQMVQNDQAEQILNSATEIVAAIQADDEQWNKLMSQLDEGLWQVRGKTPLPRYRRSIRQYQDELRQWLRDGDAL